MRNAARLGLAISLVCNFGGFRPLSLLSAIGPPRFPGTTLRFVSGPRCGRPSFLGRFVVLPPVVLHACSGLCFRSRRLRALACWARRSLWTRLGFPALRCVSGPRTGWPSCVGRFVVLSPVVLHAHFGLYLSPRRLPALVGVWAGQSQRPPPAGPFLGKGSGIGSMGSWVVLGGWVRGCGPFLGRAPVAYQEPSQPLKRWNFWFAGDFCFAACPVGRNPDPGFACPAEERTTPLGGGLAKISWPGRTQCRKHHHRHDIRPHSIQRPTVVSGSPASLIFFLEIGA